MPISQVNGVHIHWQRSGDTGDPLVLVHGSWGDHRNWASVVPRLSESFRVLTYDRRGHSGSERPEGQGSVRDDVADLAALLEHHGHAPAHVVGNSFGATIVLRLAAERPDLFRSMVIHEPPLFGLLRDDPAHGAMWAEVQRRTSGVVEVLMEQRWADGARLFTETVASGPGAWRALPDAARDTFTLNAPTWLDEMLDPETLVIDLDTLSGFRAPVLLTQGDRSPPFFPAVVEAVARVLPHARRLTYAGAGHVPHQSHPDGYLRVVTGFLAEAR